VQLGQAERAVGLGDVAEDAAGADRGELLIINNGGSPCRLLDHLSLRRVVLRITRSRSCPGGVVGDEPVPIAYSIDA
jgi:hypothetical protein